MVSRELFVAMILSCSVSGSQLQMNTLDLTALLSVSKNNGCFGLYIEFVIARDIINKRFWLLSASVLVHVNV